MWDLIRVVLYGVLPTLAATLLLFGLLGPRWFGVALAAGFYVAFALLRQELPRWPHELWAGSNDGTQWLVWSVVAVALVSPLAMRGLPRLVVLPGGALLLGIEVFLVLARRRERLPGGESAAVHAGAFVVLVVVWLLFRRALRVGPGVVLPFAWTVCFAVDAWVLVAAGSALLGQLAGAVATATGTAVVTALWRRPFALGPAAALPLAAAHVGLLVLGQQIGELRLGVALLAAVAPAGMALRRAGGGAGRAGGGRRRDEPGTAAWGVLATSLALAAAIAFALPAAA